MRILAILCLLLTSLTNAAAVPAKNLEIKKWLEIVNDTPWQITSFGLVKPVTAEEATVYTFTPVGGIASKSGALFDQFESVPDCGYYVIVGFENGAYSTSGMLADICAGTTITLSP
ncbi:MAG: hypothetical protein KBD50_03830 [Candidatus Pacebacteria bacterium]|nr:hypothetical protein [Candidatus Paceibacterota bacterium]